MPVENGLSRRDIERRRKELEQDPIKWIQYFFPKYAKYEFAPFHVRAIRRIIEHDELSRLQIICQIVENIFSDAFLIIKEQLGLISFLERMFCYALVGQVVGKVFDVYMSWILHKL